MSIRVSAPKPYSEHSKISRVKCASCAPMSQRILVIDDEEPLRELLSRYLRNRGFDVATSFCGKGAMELLDKDRFHLIILDGDLAGESGLDLLRLLKSKYPEPPVLMFTGNLDSELPEKAFAAGAIGFLRKTEPLQNLFAQICRHIAPDQSGP